jgi:hypothetical protein
LWVVALTVAGAKVMCRELETEPGGTSDPTDAIISYVQRFRFDLTPATITIPKSCQDVSLYQAKLLSTEIKSRRWWFLAECN